jgi:hypothetical protein
MSTTVLDRLTEVQDQVIEVIGSLKDPVTSAIDTVVTFVTERLDVPALPYAEYVPTPKEVIDNQAKFASKLVTTNKTVALSAARAAAPLTDKLLDRRSPVKKAAAKAAA